MEVWGGSTKAPPINNVGEVAFRNMNGDMVYGDGGLPTVVATPADIPYFQSFIDDYVDLNDAGQMIFVARTLPPGTTRDVIYIGDGINLDEVDAADSLAGIYLDLQPSINNLGQVSYRRFTASTDEIRVYDSATQTSTVRLDTSGPFAAFNRGTDINDAGDVTFWGQLDSNGPRGIFSVDTNGVVTTHATTADGFSVLGPQTDLHTSLANNNNGEVVFVADIPWANPGQQRGLFKGNDPVADAIVLVGDVLDGIEVRSVDFHNRGLNDSGEVAFETLQIDPVSGNWRGLYRTNIHGPAETAPSMGWLGAGVLVACLACAGVRRL